MDYPRDCDVLERIFATYSKSAPKSVLDVGCGTGSHALALAERGYSVVGIDISRAMIRKARAKAAKKLLSIEFAVQDMQKLKLKKSFDSAISMFGAFGFVHEYCGVVATLKSLRQHLNKDGLLIFEFWNIGGIKPTPYQRWMEAKDKRLTVYRLSETNFDHVTNIVTLDMRFIIIQRNRPTQIFSETYRLRCYTLAEIQRLLDDTGFKLLATYDRDIDDRKKHAAPRRETFRVLAIAKKR